MVANNPSLLIYQEVRSMHPQAPKLLVSIGTGDSGELPRNGAEEGTRPPPRDRSYIQEHLDTFRGMRSIVTQTETTHETVLGRIREVNNVISQFCGPGRLHRDRINYHRFNAPMRKIPLDEWKVKDGEKITKMELEEKTKTYLKTPQAHRDLLECARILVNLRRKRALTERWESFATPYVYICPEEYCGNVARVFDTREELRNHAYDAHGYISKSTITNDQHSRYVCFQDDCQQGGVHAFSREDDYYSHLLDLHKIEKKCVFQSLEKFEDWLDESRFRPSFENAVEYVKAKRRQSRLSPVPGATMYATTTTA